MQSRCCWPPESFSAGWSRLSLTSSKSPARSSALVDRRLQRLLARPPRALLAQDVGDVVEDAHRERVRLLEDHRHPAPQQRSARSRVMSTSSSVMRPLSERRAGQLGEPVERAQQRRLAAAGGADQRQHLALADRQRDRLDRRLAAVGDRDVVDLHARGSRTAGRRSPAPGAGEAAGREPWPLPLPFECRRRGGASRAAGASSRSRRRIGRRRSGTPCACLSGAAVDDVDGRVQDQHDQQQDERRRVGLLRLVEVPGRGAR